MLKPGQTHTYTVTPEQVGKRLDVFLHEQFPDYSRSLFKNLIEEAAVTINTKSITKAGTSLKNNDSIVLTIPVPIQKEALPQEDIAKFGVKIIHQNTDFAIIEKPAGIVVHPPKSTSTDASLIDWLTSTFNDIQDVGYADRPGIVHRLDKDTSGLMIIPLTSQAHALFTDMFKNREIHKTYMALVMGHPNPKGTIDFPIGRDKFIRNKMAHRRDGRASETHYSIVEYFDKTTLVKAEPVTGRTHQIRVHFSAIGHPLVGDSMYGQATHFIRRQALHALELRFTFKGTDYVFESPLPADFLRAIELVKKDTIKK